MPKIQSQSGVSLADTYDIEGSIAGVENLESADVHLFDEMGARVFSERLQAFIVRLTAGAQTQGTAWSAVASGIPDTVNRILGLTVITDQANRTSNLQVSVGNNVTGREMPIWNWATAVDDEVGIQWSDDGAGQAAFNLMSSIHGYHLPQLLTRIGAAKAMPDVIFRGITTVFGAGEVEAILLFHLARAASGNPTPGEPSSHGLPFPSW